MDILIQNIDKTKINQILNSVEKGSKKLLKK